MLRYTTSSFPDFAHRLDTMSKRRHASSMLARVLRF